MVDVGQNVDPLSASDLSLRRYLNQVQTFVSNIRSQTEHPLGRGTFHSTPDLVDQMQSLASEAQRSATSYCRAWTRIFSAQSYLSSHIADSVAIVDTMLGGSHTGSLSSRDRRRLDRHVKSLRLRRSGQTANLHSIRRTGSRPPAASPSSSFRSGAPHGENRTARALVPEADRCLHCKHKYSRHSPADCRSKCDAAGSGKCTRDQCK
ncbi:hypothetical protein DFJ73DRAFT_870090 [Zopfochytrium polystomum]|nr:hypothetical protein DFJ73DRAFT_870090 [Zopfochytrium polystomum]